MVEILLVTNLLTLIFLGMALRANWFWRQAHRSVLDQKWHQERVDSKRETARIRQENGGW